MFNLCVLLVLVLLGHLVRNSNSLTGANICQTKNGPACCYNTYEVDGRCVECPPGYYGLNCKTRCKAGFYGQACRSVCKCHMQYCDAVFGCKTTTTSTTTTTTTPTPTTTKTTKPSTTLAKTSPRPSFSVSTLGIIPETTAPGSREAYISTDSSRTAVDAVKNASMFGVQKGPGSNALHQDSSLPPSQNFNLSTIIAIVSSAVAVVLIIAIVIALINNKVKKAKKRQERGRRNERAAISVMSKIYDEINDSLVRPSCSNDGHVAGPSSDAGNAKYETIAQMRGKSNDCKGSRGSYELLDEATKHANVKQLNRGSYEPLDSVSKKTIDYESLDTNVEEDDGYEKGIKKGTKSKSSKKVHTDSDNKPVYAHVLKGTIERKASETKLKVPDDHLEPPSLPARLDSRSTENTAERKNSFEHYTVCGENKSLLVLEVDASSKRQLANSIVNESYEIPPLPKQISQSKENTPVTSKSLVVNSDETDTKQSPSLKERTEFSESNNEKSCVNENESNIENCDIPPEKVIHKFPSSGHSKGLLCQDEMSVKNNVLSNEKNDENDDDDAKSLTNYDIPPNKLSFSGHSKGPCQDETSVKDDENTQSADDDDVKSLTDYDVPPPRITNDKDDPADYDVPPGKIVLTSIGNGAIPKGGKELKDHVSDYDTPIGACVNDNYDVPPMKRM